MVDQLKPYNRQDAFSLHLRTYDSNHLFNGENLTSESGELLEARINERRFGPRKPPYKIAVLPLSGKRAIVR